MSFRINRRCPASSGVPGLVVGRGYALLIYPACLPVTRELMLSGRYVVCIFGAVPVAKRWMVARQRAVDGKGLVIKRRWQNIDSWWFLPTGVLVISFSLWMMVQWKRNGLFHTHSPDCWPFHFSFSSRACLQREIHNAPWQSGNIRLIKFSICRFYQPVKNVLTLRSWYLEVADAPKYFNKWYHIGFWRYPDMISNKSLACSCSSLCWSPFYLQY